MAARRRAPGDGSIYRRKDGKFEGSIEIGEPLGVRRRRRFVRATREEVRQAILAAQRAGVVRGRGSEIATVGDLLEAWLDVARVRVAHRTYAGYDEIVRTWLRPALGRVPLAELKPDQIERAVRSWLSSGTHPKTVKNRLDALKTALGLAVKRRILQWNPATAVEPPRVPEYVANVPTPEQFAKLLVAARTRFLGDYRPVLLLAAASGLRRGELCALTWDDFEPETGRLSVNRTIEVRRRSETRLGEKPPKGHRAADVFLPRLIVDAIESRRAEQARYLVGVSGDTRIFDDRGKTMHPDTLGKRMAKIARDAGMKGVRLHDLRHAFGTWMTNEGVSSRIVQKQMRHSDARMTARYTMQIDVGAQAAATVLDGVLRKALEGVDGLVGGLPEKAKAEKS